TRRFRSWPVPFVPLTMSLWPSQLPARSSCPWLARSPSRVAARERSGSGGVPVKPATAILRRSGRPNWQMLTLTDRVAAELPLTPESVGRQVEQVVAGIAAADRAQVRGPPVRVDGGHRRRRGGERSSGWADVD